MLKLGETAETKYFLTISRNTLRHIYFKKLEIDKKLTSGTAENDLPGNTSFRFQKFAEIYHFWHFELTILNVKGACFARNVIQISFRTD